MAKLSLREQNRIVTLAQAMDTLTMVQMDGAILCCCYRWCYGSQILLSRQVGVP